MTMGSRVYAPPVPMVIAGVVGFTRSSTIAALDGDEALVPSK